MTAHSERPGAWLGHGYMGQMGEGLPLAIGAQMAHPERRVLCFTGDGAVGFNFAEFNTMVRHALPIVVVVSSGPTFKRAIDVLEDAKHGGPIERAIVLPPPLYHRVVEPSHIGQRHVGLAIESPSAHRLPHPPQCIITGARQVAREELVLLAVSVKPRKVKLTCGCCSVRLLSLQYTTFDFSGCIVTRSPPTVTPWIASRTPPASDCGSEPPRHLRTGRTDSSGWCVASTCRRRTVVLVEHDMKLVMGVSDRILVLNYGRMLALGTSDEARRNPEVISAYLGTAV